MRSVAHLWYVLCSELLVRQDHLDPMAEMQVAIEALTEKFHKIPGFLSGPFSHTSPSSYIEYLEQSPPRLLPDATMQPLDVQSSFEDAEATVSVSASPKSRHAPSLPSPRGSVSSQASRRSSASYTPPVSVRLNATTVLKFAPREDDPRESQEDRYFASREASYDNDDVQLQDLRDVDVSLLGDSAVARRMLQTSPPTESSVLDNYWTQPWTMQNAQMEAQGAYEQQQEPKQWEQAANALSDFGEIPLLATWVPQQQQRLLQQQQEEVQARSLKAAVPRSPLQRTHHGGAKRGGPSQEDQLTEEQSNLIWGGGHSTWQKEPVRSEALALSRVTVGPRKVIGSVDIPPEHGTEYYQQQQHQMRAAPHQVGSLLTYPQQSAQQPAVGQASTGRAAPSTSMLRPSVHAIQAAQYGRMEVDPMVPAQQVLEQQRMMHPTQSLALLSAPPWSLQQQGMARQLQQQPPQDPRRAIFLQQQPQQQSGATRDMAL